MRVRVKKTGKTTDKLLKSLRQLDDSFVEVGHFAEQGFHSDSGFTYPELLALWHFGVAEGQEGVIRSPLMNFSIDQVQSGKLLNSPQFKQAMESWAKNVLNPTADDKLLEDVGRLTREQYKEVFGIVGKYMPSDSTGTPMFETGELKEATAYRTSKNKTIKES